MLSSKRKVSLRHLLLLFYLLVVGFLVTLLLNEQQDQGSSFFPSHISIDKINDPTVFSVHGEGFHPGVKAVLARSLVNEDALLWRQMAGFSIVAIDVSEDLGLIACNSNKLVSVDLHDKKKPEYKGSVELPGTIRQIKIVGDVALLAMSRHEGFYLIDLKKPADLRVIRHVPMSGLVTAMVADASMVYFTDLFAGVGRINLLVENPVPEIVFPMDSPWRIALQDNRLAVGSIKGHVQLFSLGQGGMLIKAANLDYTANVRGVAFTDEVLAVALADGSLRVFSLSSWPNLNSLAQLKLSGSPILLDRVPGREEFSVVLVASGVALVNVSRPSSPSLSGSLKLPLTFKGISLQPQFLWGVSLNGLEMYSIDEIYKSHNPSPATEAMIDGENHKLQSWRGHLYSYKNSRLLDLGEHASQDKFSSNRFLAVLEKNSVGIFTQKADEQARKVGSYAVPLELKDAHFLGEHLYVLHESGLQIVSMIQPDEPEIISELRLDGQPRFFKIMEAGHLLVCTRDNGVLVVNVNDPQQPSLVASVQTPKHLENFNFTQDILTDGQRAYLSRGKGGIHIYDMSSPSRPELIEVVGTPGRAQKMVIHDKLLLVADDVEGLFIVDVEDPDKALPVGSVSSPIRIDQIALLNDGIVVSRHPVGTMKLPLPQRAKLLKMTNEEEMRFDVEKLEKGQSLYLYDEKYSRQIKTETL